MVKDGSIHVVLTAATVTYTFENADHPDAYGVAEISGKATLFSYSEAEPLPQKFDISVQVHGRSAAQVHKASDGWKGVMNEIVDDVIGILVRVTTTSGRYTMLQGSLFLNSAQFDKLTGNLATGMEIKFYFRQSVKSESYLIGSVEFCTINIEPVF